MNTKPLDNALPAAVASYIEGVVVPDFNIAAIRSQAVRPRARRPLLAALAIASVVFAILLGMPAVIAQVQRILHAFTVVDGKTVPLTVRTVSLEQARADMPFTVIAPGAVPPRLHATIRELYSDATRSDARLMFQYETRQGVPTVTIVEYSSKQRGPNQLMVTQTAPGAKAPPPAILQAPPRNATVQLVMKNASGEQAQSVHVQPQTWTTRGTRIDLLAAPTALTPAQRTAIEASMSR